MDVEIIEQLTDDQKKLLVTVYYLGKAAEAGLIVMGDTKITPKGFDAALDLIESGVKLERKEVELYLAVLNIHPEEIHPISFIVITIQDKGFKKVMEEIEQLKSKE